MYDARLVRAAQEGDEAAFAALYDRAVDSVYDLCWSLTGDPGEAGRLVTDAFLLAAQNLGEITDPSQVRPWLLAIAADRALADDEEGVLTSGWPSAAARSDSDEPLSAAALREWVAQATAVLALPDQIVLELQLRHQLEGEQLAATIGSTVAGLPGLLGRVDDEAETVLGALVLARQGRRNCPDLGRLLRNWDGAPSVQVADLVDTHARKCGRCAQRRGVESPLDLVAEAPLVRGPASLRTPILEDAAVELAALAARPPGAAPGPPSPPTEVVPAARPPSPRPPPRGGGLPTAALAGIAAALVALLIAVVLVLRGGPSSKRNGAASASTTTAAPQAVAPGTIAPIDTTTTPTTAPPASSLALNTARVDLGSAASTAQLVLTDTATVPANWSAQAGVRWLSVSPSSGYLAANNSVRITLSVDRSAAPAGDFDAKLTFTGADAGSRAAGVDVIGTNPAPASTTTSTTIASTGLTLSNVSASPSTVYTEPCALQPTVSTVSATVSDDGGTPTVVLSYTMPDGVSGSKGMTDDGNGRWTAALPASSTRGTISFTVVASDRGASARSSGHVMVATCPGVH